MQGCSSSPTRRRNAPPWAVHRWPLRGAVGGYTSDDPGKDHLIQRIESRNGVLTVEAAAELGFGSREYELIVVD